MTATMKPAVTVTMPQETPKLISFGLGGHRVILSSTTHVSGYETPETILESYHWWAHPETHRTYHINPKLAEGCPVVDKREAVKTKAGQLWVYEGPIIDVDLEPNERTFFIGKENPCGFDSVGISTYLRGWREVGARIGMISDGEIIWEQGQI
jgi:hypothetical protein